MPPTAAAALPVHTQRPSKDAKSANRQVSKLQPMQSWQQSPLRCSAVQCSAGGEAVRHSPGATKAGHLQCAWCRPVLPGRRHILCCYSCRCAVLAWQTARAFLKGISHMHSLACSVSVLHQPLPYSFIHLSIHPPAKSLEHHLECKTCSCQQQQLSNHTRASTTCTHLEVYLSLSVYMLVCWTSAGRMSM